jgi:hypothetical protein
MGNVSSDALGLTVWREESKEKELVNERNTKHQSPNTKHLDLRGGNGGAKLQMPKFKLQKTGAGT